MLRILRLPRHTWRPWSICWVLLFHLLSSWSWSPPEASSSWMKMTPQKWADKNLLQNEISISVFPESSKLIWTILTNRKLYLILLKNHLNLVWSLSFLNYKRKSSVPASKHLAEYEILYWSIKMCSIQHGPWTIAGWLFGPC